MQPSRINPKTGTDLRKRAREELIDHLLISHALLDHIDDVTTRSGPAPAVTDDSTERRDAAGSGHRPVVAQLPH